MFLPLQIVFLRLLVGALLSHQNQRALLLIGLFILLRVGCSFLVALANLFRYLNPILLRKAYLALIFDKILKHSLAAQRTHQARLLNMTSGDVAIIENASLPVPPGAARLFALRSPRS